MFADYRNNLFQTSSASDASVKHELSFAIRFMSFELQSTPNDIMYQKFSLQVLVFNSYLIT